MSVLIYHIADEAHLPDEGGHYTCPSLNTEGFVHCAFREQLAGVVLRYFADWKVDDAGLYESLHVITISASALTSELIVEDTVGAGERFPHVYGPVNADAVVAVQPLTTTFLAELVC